MSLCIFIVQFIAFFFKHLSSINKQLLNFKIPTTILLFIFYLLDLKFITYY